MTNTNRFGWEQDEFTLSQCDLCAHRMNGAVCKAFPHGIPDPIMLNEVDHRQPYEGDHGIHWEPEDPGDKHPMDAKE
jgi:hypothetical protein